MGQRLARGILSIGLVAMLTGVGFSGQAEPPVPEARFLPTGPLAEDLREQVWETPWDPAPEKLLGVSEAHEGQHFVAGNELALFAFEPHVRGLGGAYMGVGSDQAYVLMGWQRPEVAWLTDYDIYVVRIHVLHLLFFGVAAGPDEYLRLWSEDGAADAKRLIKASAKSPSEAKRLAHRYRNSSGRVYRRLQSLKRKMTIPFYLTDQAQYDHIRTMHLEHRIRPLRANLLAEKGFRGVGAVATALGVPVRVIYLSNAEQYWEYGDAFRANLRSLPCDDRSLVLRTLGSFLGNKDYRYVVQKLGVFQALLENPRFVTLKPHIHRRKLTGRGDIDLIELTLGVDDLR